MPGKLRTEYISTGLESLDELFKGFPKKAISQFWGLAGVSKTTLSVYIPIVQILKAELVTRQCKSIKELQKYYKKKKLGKPVFIIIDTESGIDFDRLFQIVTAHGFEQEEVEDMIVYLTCSTFTEQHNLVWKGLLGGRMGKGGSIHINSIIGGETKEYPKLYPLLIALDSVTWLYKNALMAIEPRFRMPRIGMMCNKLGTQLAILKKISMDYNCVITVTNWEASSLGAALDPEATREVPFLGGRDLGFIPKSVIEVIKPTLPEEAPPEWEDMRIAKVWKHRSTPSGRIAHFVLTSYGIDEVPDEE